MTVDSSTALVAGALLRRMLAVPGRPNSRSARWEDDALRWVVAGCKPISGSLKIRHLVSLRRRWNRTGLYLGFGNRHARALEWAINEARHG